MSIKNFKIILIIYSFFLLSCSEENENKSKYKKKSDIPLTGQSFDKKNNPRKKVSDFY